MIRGFTTRTLAPALLMLLLSACLLVKDFSAPWESAKPDFCITKIAEALYYSEFRRDPSGKDMEKHARAMTLGGQHFLLLKKDEADTGGRMYRFSIENGIFKRYRLNPTMRKTFEKDHPEAAVSFKWDTVTLSALDEPTIKLLTEIANKPEYWEVEDQTLYNVLHNPLCRFEDRDLDALKDEKPKQLKKEFKKEKK